MRLFSQTSKLCLLTLLLLLVYGGNGQGEKQISIFKSRLLERRGKERIIKNAGKCGKRFISNSGVTSLIHFGRSPVGVADSKSPADYKNVETYLNDETRIVGGQNANPREVPWQGRLHLIDGKHLQLGIKRNTHWCGAIIISEYWLLTAAHCFMNFTEEPIFRVHVGDYDIRKNSTGEQIFEIQNLIIHENYNDLTKDNDIALIKIQPKRPRGGIMFSPTVQPVCLPHRYTDFRPDTRCTVSGWGDHFEKDPKISRGHFKNPAILQKAEVEIIDQHTCRQSYPSLTKNMICAGYMNGKIDSCQGDSGGPLVCNVRNVYTLSGIVSFGIGCAWPGYPGVYARVTEFITWIKYYTKL